MKELTPQRIGELRQLPPEARLREAERLWWEARRAMADTIRAAHPDWAENSIQAEVNRRFLSEAMMEG